MPIRKLSAQSKVGEVDGSIQQIIAGYDKTVALHDDDNLSGIMNEVKPKSLELTTAISQMRAESTRDEKDLMRDESYRAMYHMVKGYTYNPSKTIREHAQNIDVVMENHGGDITQESYTIQSSHLNSILTDFKMPKLAESVEALPGMSVQVQKVADHQAEFEKVSLEYSEAKSDSSKSATDIKKEILPLINEKLIIYLQGMAVVDHENYGSFAGTVAQIIADNNSAVNKRKNN